jgi:hypothetical protein
MAIRKGRPRRFSVYQAGRGRLPVMVVARGRSFEAVYMERFSLR